MMLTLMMLTVMMLTVIIMVMVRVMVSIVLGVNGSSSTVIMSTDCTVLLLIALVVIK